MQPRKTDVCGESAGSRRIPHSTSNGVVAIKRLFYFNLSFTGGIEWFGGKLNNAGCSILRKVSDIDPSVFVILKESWVNYRASCID